MPEVERPLLSIALFAHTCQDGFGHWKRETRLAPTFFSRVTQFSNLGARRTQESVIAGSHCGTLLPLRGSDSRISTTRPDPGPPGETENQGENQDAQCNLPSR